MNKIVIYNQELIRQIVTNKKKSDKLTIYIMGINEKLAIIKTDKMKRRVFIPIEKISRVVKNI